SSSPIGKLSCSRILPVSMACCNRKVVTPVTASPLITAQLMGAAPRYCGSSDPWRLTVPFGGMDQTTSGSMRKATTICRSAFSPRNSSRNPGFFSRSGCSSGNPLSKAYFFTALADSCIPRPAGLSGAVNTPTTLYPAATMASRLATANSGVPMKTIRGSVGIKQVFFPDGFELLQTGLPGLADSFPGQPLLHLFPEDGAARQSVKAAAAPKKKRILFGRQRP